MIRRPPRSTRTDTLFPYTTLFRSEKAREKFRLQWTENAEHVTPLLLPTNPARATTTWLIDYMPSIEQGLADLATWVAKGLPPAETSYSFSDGKVSLPAGAARSEERRVGTECVRTSRSRGPPYD